MNAAKPSAQDEARFMELLLSGIDASIFEGAPSPDPSPSKRRMMGTRSNMKSPDKSKSKQTSRSTKEKENVTQAEDIAALLEGAETWDWDDLLTPPRKKIKVENVNVGTANDKSNLHESSNTVIRCVAEAIETNSSTKTVKALCKTDGAHKVIILEHDWVETDVRKGDHFHVIGAFSPFDTTIRITSKQNMLILHPDILLTATSIASAGHCIRKPLISLLVRSQSDVSPSLVFGNMLHDVMQHCLLSDKWDVASVSDFVHEVVQANLSSFFQLKMNEDEAEREVMKRADNFLQFSQRYIRTDKVSYPNKARNGEDSLLISKVNCVEEDILVPKYGLKGKVDASVLVSATQPSKGRANTISRSTVAAPFEIKTGRAVAGVEHRAQTILYTILMAERYGQAFPSGADQPSPSGLLYYTHSEDLIQVPARWNELRGLMMTRNFLASYLSRREETKVSDSDTDTFLPPTIDSERTCGRCYVSDACLLYKKALEKADESSSPIAELVKIKTGHLSTSQLDFFRHWEQLLSLEEHHQHRFRKELWSLGAHERQKLGRCISDLILDPRFASQNRRQPVKSVQSNQYSYRFITNPNDPMLSLDTTIHRNLRDGQIDIGDAVSISVAGSERFLSLSRGFVKEISSDSITVGVDQVIPIDTIRELCPHQAKGDVTFRIDKDEMAGGMARVRDNLAQLFYASGNRRLLELIVDLKRPEFLHDCSLAHQRHLEHLNDAQKGAIELSLRAKEYALILGMPGTGKTTTIASLIAELVARGKSVLLTSFTHSAVDTILSKIQNDIRPKVLRLGNLVKIDPKNHDLALEAKGKVTTVKELENRLLTPKVVACTALSTDHPIFSRRYFDYCIVDEASQITLPTCLGPLRFANKFILVGDHNQLPAVVKSKLARKGGLDVSLFKHLSEAQPHAVAKLDRQYRMSKDIMLLSNALVYKNSLICGSERVANQSLKLPRPKTPACGCPAHLTRCWIQHLLQESCKAVFVDTDNVPALDSNVGSLIQNTVEAELVTQFTKALLENGVAEQQIGIISLYRQQMKLLSNKLAGHQGIELLTADRSQGRDKDCILISLVRANEDNNIGDLLKDWRRVNVAFTRARSKLVIFGSRKTLKASPLLSEFFQLMESNKWVLTLPAKADAMHVRIPSSQTQSSQTLRKGPKYASVDSGLLRSRPILRDVFNDLS